HTSMRSSDRRGGKSQSPGRAVPAASGCPLPIGTAPFSLKSAQGLLRPRSFTPRIILERLGFPSTDGAPRVDSRGALHFGHCCCRHGRHRTRLILVRTEGACEIPVDVGGKSLRGFDIGSPAG